LIRIDLHLHTTYSPDALIPPKTIVNQLHAHPFIKAIAITDHNTVEGYRKVKKLASAYQDILIIPGIEVSAVYGDLIVLGVAETPSKPWTVENVIDFAKESDGLVVVAHPYRAYGLGDLAKNYDFDAVEVLNGISPHHVNKMAENLAKAMGLPGVAGSDAHHVEEMWTVYTEVQASLDIDEIFKSIQEGLVKVAYTGKSIHF
jgi:predicted metal-dependent phosphoesterase TrpH